MKTIQTCEDCHFFDGLTCDWTGLKVDKTTEACEDARNNFSLYDEADVMFLNKNKGGIDNEET